VGSNDFVRNRSARHRDAHHVAARAVYSLAHCFRDFVRLSGSKANASLRITDGDKSVEGEPASALYDLRDTIDRDDVLDELAATVTTTAFAIASLAPVATSTATGSASVVAALAATLSTTRAATATSAAATTGATASTTATTSASTRAASATGASTHARTLLLGSRC
jgi:hypothetical protein